MGYVSFLSYRKPVRFIKRERIEAWKIRNKLKKMRKESFQKLFALEGAFPGESAVHLPTEQDPYKQ
jgi:hypothetical protein